MKHNAVTLSVEELAYAMGVLGGVDVANGYLTALLGERPQREMEGRLLAASHSLVARGQLEFDPGTGDKHLSAELAGMVGVLIRNDYFLRCTRASEGREEIVNFYVAGGHCIEHRLEKSVAACLTELSSCDEIVEQAVTFFDLHVGSDAEEHAQSVGAIPAALFEKIGQERLHATPEQIAAQLTAGGLPASAASAMAADLSSLAYRGSVMKVMMRSGALVADAAFLIFKGSHGYWILEVVAEEPPNLRVFVGGLDQFRRSIQALTA